MIAGRGEAGAIVWTPVPGMAKSIVLVPPVAALESRMAWRSEPGPLSAVVVTTNDAVGDEDLGLERGRAVRLGIQGHEAWCPGSPAAG